MTKLYEDYVSKLESSKSIHIDKITSADKKDIGGGSSSRQHDQTSPYRTTPSANIKHVVIVIDALKEFSVELLQWTLDHVIGSGYVITLLGVMPWLNLLLSSKTRLDIWTLNLEDLPTLLEKSDANNDIKYQKLREIINLCEKYGVVPYMKVVMGYPLRLLILEHTTGLHATWVVFDRHHWKNRSFYAKRLPCNVAMMNGVGEVYMIKVGTIIIGKTTPEESSRLMSLAQNSKLIFSEKLMGGFHRRRHRWSSKVQKRHDKSASFSCLSI